MHLIYLHGLDSDPNAIKAQITQAYCDTHLASILPAFRLSRPNLNLPPDDVVALLTDLIQQEANTVLIGSSLGGYFATLMSDLTGVPAVLLNPSIRPDVSFRRFLANNFHGQTLADDTVIYTTVGGWRIRFGDLAWFSQHRLQVKQPSRLKVLVQLGDELLDAAATQDFYASQGADVLALAGGDHRISDFERHVATVADWAVQLTKAQTVRT
ncbi:MAG: YqiA/YcfP family alpha/beta fold hydrolase [Moraxella sp.]|nr:YqiA/YcfP family alpha/beta fold hydrolase [Moraxella sp.]